MELKDQKYSEKKQFVENIGMFFETQHLPRMAGRILGWLLICTPPYQTAAEIGETLEMSKGSVSTMTRLLIQMGMIEKISRIGERHDFYRIQSRANEQLLRARLAEFTQLQGLAKQGLALMDKENLPDRCRLLGLSKMCAIATQAISMIITQIETTENEVVAYDHTLGTIINSSEVK